MPTATFTFPQGFLWGTATAAHQVEGRNTNNNWYAWEQTPGKIINGQQSGLACDWWGGRWREDFDRAREGGQNAHRLSIEWSRIQPAPDRWDEDALERYRAILRGLAERNMVVMVTLHHFTDPLWLTEMGGWENPAAVEHFVRFVRRSVDALKELCSYWVTFNEPNVYAFNGYLAKAFPPGKRDLMAVMRVYTHMIRAHGLAYRAIHEIQPYARVGISTNYRDERPAGPLTFLDNIPVRLVDQAFNRAFNDALVGGKLRLAFLRAAIPEAARTQDFIGVNYYTRDLFRLSLLHPETGFVHVFFPPGADLSDTGFLANVPEGMTAALKWANGFKLPILVTENGVEDSDDHLRPRYLIQHLHQIWRGINFNWPIKGYFHWSLVDNFEWERGWTQRFGLWGLDPETQQRIRRPSVDLYAAICKQNAISYETVEKFAPQILPNLFPE